MRAWCRFDERRAGQRRRPPTRELPLQRLECDGERHLGPLAQRAREYELLRGMSAASARSEAIYGQRDRRGEVARVAGAAPGLRDDRAADPRTRAREQLSGAVARV